MPALHIVTLWFNQESFEQLLQWMFRTAVVMIGRGAKLPIDQATREIMRQYALITELLSAEQKSKYQVERLLAATKG